MTYLPKERILCGGASNAGKTYAFLTIVRALNKGHHVAIEADDGFARLLGLEFPDIKATIFDLVDGKWTARPDFQGGDQLLVYHARSFTAVRKAQVELEKRVNGGQMGRGDWICLDGLDLIYNNQRYQMIENAVPTKTQRRRDLQNFEDAWEAAIEIKRTGAPILDPPDWDTIHTFFEEFLSYCVFQVPCNLYATTGVTPLDERSDYVQDEVKDFYRSMGVPFKLEGQKRAPRAFDTIIMMKADPSGHYVNIWKDRGGNGRPWRKKLRAGQNAALTNFTCSDFYTDIGMTGFGWNGEPQVKSVNDASDV
jgi:hypothetical protein